MKVKRQRKKIYWHHLDKVRDEDKVRYKCADKDNYNNKTKTNRQTDEEISDTITECKQEKNIAKTSW